MVKPPSLSRLHRSYVRSVLRGDWAVHWNRGSHKHEDPTKDSLRNPPCLRPVNQNAGSACLCGLWGPYEHEVPGNVVARFEVCLGP